MIRSFRSKALKRFWEKADASGLRPDWVKRIRILLDALNQADEPSALNEIGAGFHALTGNLKDRFSLIVSRNWRLTFAWDRNDAVDVDLEDYHGS